jgi:hypothetical protein
MPRIVRCGLIQARNILGPDRSLAEIKQAMIQKHVGLIEQAVTVPQELDTSLVLSQGRAQRGLADRRRAQRPCAFL